MNDDELLEFLRRTLAAPIAPPPPEGIAALHRALTEQGVVSRPRGRLRHRWVIPAVTTGLVFGGAAGAMAAAGIPEPVRDVAHLLRLPVSDPHRPSIPELVRKLQTDRARGDSRAADRHARELEGLLRRGSGNATERDNASKALNEAGPGAPQPASRPVVTTTTAPSEGHSPGTETEPPTAPPSTAPTETTEPDATVTQPSSPTPTTEAPAAEPATPSPPSPGEQ